MIKKSNHSKIKDAPEKVCSVHHDNVQCFWLGFEGESGIFALPYFPVQQHTGHRKCEQPNL